MESLLKRQFNFTYHNIKFDARRFFLLLLLFFSINNKSNEDKSYRENHPKIVIYKPVLIEVAHWNANEKDAKQYWNQVVNRGAMAAIDLKKYHV